MSAAVDRVAEAIFGNAYRRAVAWEKENARSGVFDESEFPNAALEKARMQMIASKAIAAAQPVASDTEPGDPADVGEEHRDPIALRAYIAFLSERFPLERETKPGGRDINAAFFEGWKAALAAPSTESTPNPNCPHSSAYECRDNGCFGENRPAAGTEPVYRNADGTHYANTTAPPGTEPTLIEPQIDYAFDLWRASMAYPWRSAEQLKTERFHFAGGMRIAFELFRPTAPPTQMGADAVTPISDAGSPDGTPFMYAVHVDRYEAANTLAAVMAYPDSGDWHAQMRTKLELVARGYQANRISAFGIVDETLTCNECDAEQSCCGLGIGGRYCCDRCSHPCIEEQIIEAITGRDWAAIPDTERPALLASARSVRAMIEPRA